MMRALRYIKRLISRLLGIEMLADLSRAQMDLIERSSQQSSQQIAVLQEQVRVLREQVGGLREDVSSLSTATNNTGANISLVYDCLIELDRDKRTKAD